MKASAPGGRSPRWARRVRGDGVPLVVGDRPARHRDLLQMPQEQSERAPGLEA